MYNLTIPQKNIWNLQKCYENTSIANICASILFDEKLESALLVEALQKMVSLQNGLRMNFFEKDGQILQKVRSPFSFSVPVLHFVNEAELAQYANILSRVAFALEDVQLFRIVIFEMHDRSGLLLCSSHLISDAWTIHLIAKQTYAIYHSLRTGSGAFPTEGDYLSIIRSEQRYLASGLYQKDRIYWENRYLEKPDHSPVKSNATEGDVSLATRYTQTLTTQQTKAIQSTEYTPAVLFEAAMLAYLAKINYENRNVTIGVLVLNRAGHKEKNTAGMCVTTLPLTIAVTEDLLLRDLCSEVASASCQLFRHQKYPYRDILRSIRERHSFAGNLYDVIVSYQNTSLDLPASSKWYSNGYCEVPLEVHIDDRSHTGQYQLTFDYQVSSFSRADILLFAERYLHVLQQLIESPDLPLKELSILPSAERQKVLYTFNNTSTDYSKDKCIHEIFIEQAAKTPNRIALVFKDCSFTYRQLDEMSNALAHHLRSKGIKPNEAVPILAKRSWHIIVAMLGILKAGGAYMPVDPSYPIHRILSMFRLAKCRIALIYAYPHPLPIPCLDLSSFDFSSHADRIPNINTPEDLCYIIFTSGSTGTPKGVSLCHRNVANYAARSEKNICNFNTVSTCRSIVAVTNVIFDIFVTESLHPLLYGLTIYFASEEQTSSQSQLSELISRFHIDAIQTTPTKMRSFLLDKSNLAYLKDLKEIILGGESFPVDLYQELRKYTNACIYNIYGPAETTVWSTNKLVTSPQITIGTPIANTKIYILDKYRRPLPIGIAGELCISGDGVGKGYLSLPELTLQKFVADPFSPGKTMYCTGDLACWQANGEIEYLGRIDTQVKIRGLRIELGEIESVMATFPGIRLTAATDRRDPQGRQYLVGYYTAAAPLDEKALRSYLQRKLPQYMVPNYFVFLQEMPLTASGKTDRKLLPSPEFAQQNKEYVAPRTETETVLCRILATLFKMERIGITDDFFELGGDSLCAIEYAARAHTYGIDFPLQRVFDCPTVQQLCTASIEKKSDTVAFRPDDFAKYHTILAQNRITNSLPLSQRPLGNVLLTGATGFLGAHLLDQYIKTETGTLYCLVRGGVPHLQETLFHYFGAQYQEQLGRRIIAIPGDITDDQLCETLPQQVDTVIHAAATVKHYGPYSHFHSINVQGTKNILKYVHKIKARMLHISTISVSGNSLADTFDLSQMPSETNFTEADFYVGQPLENNYVRSKFEAERAVLDAILDGADAKIVRIGNLTNRTGDFKFQKNYASNAFLTRFHAGLALRAIPDYLLPLYAEFSPVDQTAEGILKIAVHAEEQTVFHLNSNRPIYFSRLIEVLDLLGIKISVCSGDAFYQLLQKAALDPASAYLYEAFQNDLDHSGKLSYASNIHIKNDFTIWFLTQIGFQWAAIDRDYIKGYVEYFCKMGYFKV